MTARSRLPFLWEWLPATMEQSGVGSQLTATKVRLTIDRPHSAFRAVINTSVHHHLV